jgi:hypothetical protein
VDVTGSGGCCGVAQVDSAGVLPRPGRGHVRRALGVMKARGGRPFHGCLHTDHGAGTLSVAMPHRRCPCRLAPRRPFQVVDRIAPFARACSSCLGVIVEWCWSAHGMH